MVAYMFVYLLVCLLVQRDIPQCLAESLARAGPSLCSVCVALPDTPCQIRGTPSSGTTAKNRYKTQRGTFEFTQICKNFKSLFYVCRRSFISGLTQQLCPAEHHSVSRLLCHEVCPLCHLCERTHAHRLPGLWATASADRGGSGEEPTEGDSAADLDDKPVKNFLSEFIMILSFKCHNKWAKILSSSISHSYFIVLMNSLFLNVENSENKDRIGVSHLFTCCV